MLEPLYQYKDDHQNQFVQVRNEHYYDILLGVGTHTYTLLLNCIMIQIYMFLCCSEVNREKPKKPKMKVAHGFGSLGNLYGRGATDNKGPVLAWLHAVESYQATEKEIPVNIKLIIEGLEEVGSYGLLELTRKRNDSFFADVDFIVISDNVCATRTPALTYETIYSCYLFQVDCPKLDFHPRVYGGSIQEPMSDLIALLGSLLDHTGKILVPGVTDDVAPLTEDERKLYDNIMINCNPSLSIHGIQGAFSEPSTKTVIPKQVTGKFSIRQVPNMDPPDVERKVKEHLQQVFSTLKSPNRVTTTVGAKPWVANLKDPLYVAGQRAVREVFGVEPELIREGSTIPIALNFQEEMEPDVMMLPIGGHDDGEHSQNEKISRYNYIEGTKLLADDFDEISLLQKVQDIFPSKL
uniref:Peptidase M20 dimerisation domain-containing protein n=1 Tax=Oncorhynchus kisutch TaxID=8019 RepID=A0A8C7CVJ5_ONCKI